MDESNMIEPNPTHLAEYVLDGIETAMFSPCCLNTSDGGDRRELNASSSRSSWQTQNAYRIFTMFLKPKFGTVEQEVLATPPGTSKLPMAQTCLSMLRW